MSISDLRAKAGWKWDQAQGRMGFTFHCVNKCGNTETIYANNGSGILPDSLRDKKISQKGWRISKKGDTCPACLAQARVLNEGKFELRKAMETAMTVRNKNTTPKVINGPRVTPVVEPVRPWAAIEAEPVAKEAEPEGKPMVKEVGGEMSAIMRRSVFRRLDAAWDDSKNRYRPGETDEKIAGELDISVSWVREVRVDSFGGLSNEQAKVEALGALHLLALKIEDHGRKMVELQNAYAIIGEALAGAEQVNLGFTEQVEAVRQKIEALG